MLGRFLRALERRIGSPETIFRFGEVLFRWAGYRPGVVSTDLKQLRAILVIRLDEIGDVVLTVPFLRELRKNSPKAFISIVVKPLLAPLLEECPYVDEVLILDWSVNGRFALLRRHGRALALAARALWRRPFDLAIVPRWDHDSYHASFLAYFSGAPWRVGYSESVNETKRVMETHYDLLYTNLSIESNVKHEVLRGLDLLKSIGGTVDDDRLELWVSPSDMDWARRQTATLAPGIPHVAFGVGTRLAFKKWPLAHYRALANDMVEKGYSIVLLGGAEDLIGDAPALWHLPADRLLDMRAKATLLQTAALVKECACYIGNDTGVMHIAAAVGVPVVEISLVAEEKFIFWGGPKRFKPWGVPYRIVAPVFPAAIDTVQPSAVLDAAFAKPCNAEVWPL